MFRNIILFAIVLCLQLVAHAQQQNNNWYFGNRGALRFSAGKVVTIGDNQMVSSESCASVSDQETGELLFYSNGLAVWNAQGDTMKNGGGILGGENTSSSRGVVIAPVPGNNNLYYLFTADESIGGAVNGFRYSIVDMGLDNGLGAVVDGKKNVLVNNNTTERIAVTGTKDGSGFWVVIHERVTNRFLAYKVSVNGIDRNPVVSAVGDVHRTVPSVDGDPTMGCMKFSRKGDMLAVAIFTDNKVQVFSFDNCTGSLSDPRTINTLDHPYGIEFSPNGSKLYYTMFDKASFLGAVFQVDLSDADPSRSSVVGLSSSLNYYCVGALQIGPDGIIYVAINSEPWLSAITEPDNKGGACKFVDKAVVFPLVGFTSSTSVLGLPAKVIDRGDVVRPNYNLRYGDSCIGRSISFALNNYPDGTGIKWFVAGGDRLLLTDSSSVATVVFPTAGLYNVIAVTDGQCNSDTVKATITVSDCDVKSASCDAVIPDAFTPDNDGLNDNFAPILTCPVAGYLFNIYNRWGELMFSAENPDEEWDGTFRGTPADLGVYYYTFQYFKDGSVFRKGSVTLIR
jgi:gliding motility-associated-like protein